MDSLLQRRCASLALGLSMAVAAGSAFAQAAAWPDKPLRIILPSGPGSFLDVAARLVGDSLATALRQPVLVEGKPGASGMIAISAVTKAPADGLTLLFVNTSVLQNVILQPNPPYKLADLVPVAMVSKNPIGMAVTTSAKVDSLAALAQAAHADPKAFTYGSAGRGNSTNVVAEMFKRAAKVEMTHVPYNGEGPAITALAGGHVSVALGTPGQLAKQAPRVKLLAITGTSRDPALPGVPTFAEAGFPGVNIEGGFFGFFVPAGTPKDVVERLSREIVTIMGTPRIRQLLVDSGARPVAMNAGEFADYLKLDLLRWQAAIKDNNITLD